MEKDVGSAINSIRTETRLPEFVGKDQMIDIMEHFTEVDFATSRESLMFELFYGTGIRLSELYDMKLPDINPDMVDGACGTNGNSQESLLSDAMSLMGATVITE